MKILLIGPKSKENKLLAEAATNHGHLLTRASIRELSYELHENKFGIFHNEQDIAEFDICLIRGVSPYFDQAKTVAKYLHRHGKQVIDKELYNHVYTFDKMFMYSALNHHGLPVMDTYYFPSLKEFKKAEKKIKYPILAKDTHGMHGRNIFFINSKKEFLELIKKMPIKRFFLQQIIVADDYYRVLVVGRQVLGVMKRYTLQYLQENTVPLAKRSRNTELTEELRTLGLDAASAVNSDISGVDIIIDSNGKHYILEVNRSPNFKRFTSVTKTDVASNIIQYLEKQV